MPIGDEIPELFPDDEGLPWWKGGGGGAINPFPGGTTGFGGVPGGGGGSFGFGPEFSGQNVFGRRRRETAYGFAPLEQGGAGTTTAAAGRPGAAMPAAAAGGWGGRLGGGGIGKGRGGLLGGWGGGGAPQDTGPESWEDFLQRWMEGNDTERIIGMNIDAFLPDSRALSSAQERVIRDRGEGRRLGALNRARLDAGGDPSLTAYANIQSQMDTGNELSTAMNEAELARRQALEDFIRQLFMARNQGTINEHLSRISQPQGGGGGFGFTLPEGIPGLGGLGFNFG